MLKKLLLTIPVLLCISFAFAQNSIRGKVTDSTTHADLNNAVVSLLRGKDSVLIKFARIDKSGVFDIKNVPSGKYVLLISHPKFADYADVLDAKESVDLGIINMFSKATILQDVIVHGSPIRMKGDTLAYMADSFKVKEGATVEDLLKRLPGIQVNSKGEITAQGERVEKVLVDGEEFFGDDPTLATQNMIAKAVKEVQVFDKKSDQATFTGVDDGQKTKTINLKLKDEFKKGYFGKANVAGGLPDSWQNSAMINAFKDKRKISVYGKMANTGQTGLGWGEDNQYGGGMGVQTEIGDDGSMSMYVNGDDFGGMGSYGGEGLPKSWMAGTSYSNKWNADKNSVNGAYRYQKLNTQGTTTTNTQTILADTQYFNNEVAKTQASRWRQKANLKSEINIDSSQSLTVTADGSYGKSYSNSLLTSEALTADTILVNRNERATISNATASIFNSNVLYKKKFKKKGRTFSFNLAEKYNNTVSDGFLLSRLQQFNELGVYQETDTINQKKDNDTHSLTVDGRAAYTEPIGKKAVVELSYGYSISNSEQKRLSYDENNGKYETLNDLYSNDYKFNIGTHKAGVGYRYNYKKVTFGFGSDMTLSKWKQTDLFKDTVRNYNFNNFFPKANASYKLGQYSRLRFNYNGRTQAPNINQLQPVANNADPLNIAVGNPDLKQSFTNRFDIGYNFYQVLKEQGLWASFNYSTVNNAFSTRDSVSRGKRIYQTVNVDGNYNFGGWAGYNFKWKKPEIQFNFQFNPSISRIENFVNGEPNETISSALSFGFGAGQYKDKKYNWNLGMDASRTYSKSSINPDAITKYWSATPHFDFNLNLPKRIEASTELNYNWRQKTPVFNNNNTFIWNAGITKKIMKKQDMKLGLEVHDILNQNNGFRRDVSSNYITEKTYNTIRRYWLATFSWNFNKGPKKDESW